MKRKLTNSSTQKKKKKKKPKTFGLLVTYITKLPGRTKTTYYERWRWWKWYYMYKICFSKPVSSNVQFLIHNYIILAIGSITFSISKWDIILAMVNINKWASFWWSLATTTGCLAVQKDQILLHICTNRRSRTTRLTRDLTTSSMSSRIDTTCWNLKQNGIVRITVTFT